MDRINIFVDALVIYWPATQFWQPHSLDMKFLPKLDSSHGCSAAQENDHFKSCFQAVHASRHNRNTINLYTISGHLKRRLAVDNYVVHVT